MSSFLSTSETIGFLRTGGMTMVMPQFLTLTIPPVRHWWNGVVENGAYQIERFCFCSSGQKYS